MSSRKWQVFKLRNTLNFRISSVVPLWFAASDARRVKEEQLKYFCVHRPDADVDYINTLLREVNDPEVLVVAGLVTNSILFF